MFELWRNTVCSKLELLSRVKIKPFQRQHHSFKYKGNKSYFYYRWHLSDGKFILSMWRWCKRQRRVFWKIVFTFWFSERHAVMWILCFGAKVLELAPLRAVHANYVISRSSNFLSFLCQPARLALLIKGQKGKSEGRERRRRQHVLYY